MVGSWKDALEDDLLLEGFRLVGRFSQPWGGGGGISQSWWPQQQEEPLHQD